MIEWLAVAGLAAFSLAGPIVKRGGVRAWHNPIKVTLPHDITSLEQGQHPEGRKTQEIGEWRVISLLALIPSIGAAFAIDGAFAALGAVVAWFVAKFFLYKLQFIDTAGHGAEILTAEEDGLWSYREQEVRRMLNDPKRSGKTFEEVHAEVASMEWLSKIMVKLAW